MRTPIWNNPNISTVNLFNNNLYKKGCIYIADICDPSYKIYDQQFIKNAFNTTINFLEYLRITKGLIGYFKKLTNSPPFVKPIQPLITSLMHRKVKGSRVFYNVLINQDQSEPPNFKIRWSLEFRKNFTDTEWKKIFMICNKSIPDNELKWFQYRVIHNILGTKSLLYKINKSSTNLCRLCQEREETVSHLLYECGLVTNLRNELCVWINNSIGIHCNPTLSEVILGRLDNPKFALSQNIIFLLFKHYIFQSVTLSLPLNLHTFLIKVKKIVNEQKYVAKINLEEEKFNKKWNLITSLIQTI